MKKNLLCFLAFFLFSASFAQTTKVYNQSNSGFSYDKILGFSNIDDVIWVGQSQGCSYFDGTTWVNFTWEDMNSPSEWIHIHDFEEDSNGEIWVAGEGGLFHYTWDDVWTRYASDVTPELEEGSTFQALEIDDNGIIWAVSTNTVYSYLYSLDPSDMTWVSYFISGQSIWDMRLDDSGKLILTSTDSGFMEFDGTSFTVMGGHTTFGFGADEQGNYWSGSYNENSGLYQYDDEFNQLAFYNSNNSLMPYNWLYDVTYSNESGTKGAWFCASSGYWEYKGVGVFDDAKNFFLWFDQSTGLPFIDVQAVHLHDNQAWLGTHDNGAMHIDFDESPLLSVDTGVVVVQVPSESIQTFPVSIINNGAGTLSYDLNIYNTQWLNSPTMSGTVVGTGNVLHEMIFDASDFSLPGTYETTLKIESNGGIGYLKMIMEVVDQTALEFDGVDDYVQTSFPGIFENNSRTFQAWIYLTEAPTGDMCILDFGADEVDGRNTFMVNQDGYLQYDNGGDVLVGTSVGTLPIGEWVHVAFVYDGSEGFLYVNADIADSGTMDILTPENEEPLRIGENILGDMPFKGMMDQVNIWQTGMEDDILPCFEGSMPEQMVAYYDFNDKSGMTLTELVDGWDGTLENMTEDAWVASTVCTASYNVSFVVTKDDGITPIENVMINLDGVIQYTDASGETDFEASPGTYNYTVTKAGYFDVSSTVEVALTNVVVDLSLTLNGINNDITFIVVDDLSGDPIEDALVDIDGVQQYTDASGETVFVEYLPEIYNYSITKGGYFNVYGDVEVIDENITVQANMIVESPTALAFDGVDEYVQTTFSGVMGNNPRTLMAWIYLDEASSGTRCIMDYGENSPYSRNTFMVNGSGYLSYLSGGSGSGLTADVASVPVGEWVSVALVYDGSNAFLYQNGEQVGTKTFTYGINTFAGGENFKIGQRVAGGSIPFNGIIDAIGVWDVALTQQEVINYACIGNPLQYENLLAYYNFNNGSGTILTDLVGGNDGTLMNMEEEDWVESDVCTNGHNITFIVTEGGTTPVGFAEVDLDGDIKSTNEDGAVTFYYQVPGTYDYTVSKDGYYDQSGTVDVIDQDVTAEVDLLFTGIFNTESAGVNVYPNPTDGIVHISLADDNGCKVVVNDISGRIIDTFELSNSNETIDLSGVQEGIYFLEIQMKNKVVTLPLVVK